MLSAIYDHEENCLKFLSEALNKKQKILWDDMAEELKNLSFSKQKGNLKRILFKDKLKLPENSMLGRVVYSYGKVLFVKVFDKNDDAFGCGKLYECTMAGTIVARNVNASIAAVGDYVYFTPEISSESSEFPAGKIISIEERTAMLSRKSIIGPKEDVIAANIDGLVIIMSVAEPQYNCRLIDRFLVSAECGSLAAGICINKTDLFEPELYEEDFKVYHDLNVPVFFTSVKTGSGVEEFSAYLKGKDTVLSGPSGAGKSSLINLLLGNNAMAVREVSEKTAKGKHTTTFARLFELPFTGSVIDTPGIRELGIYGIPKEELSLYFHDFDKYFPLCRFPGCSHTHEPDCAVKTAVESEEIDYSRYESYLNIYDSLI